MRRIVIAAFALTVLAACQPAPSNDESAQAPMSPEAAVADVRQVFQQYVDDWNAVNLDGVFAVLADDVVHMSPSVTSVGKEAVSARFRQVLDDNADVWEPTIEEIQAAGNLVFIRTAATETMTPRAGGDTTTFVLKGVTVFQRDAFGAWKMVLEQFFEEDSGA